MGQHSEDVMWQATVNNDGGYDGRFFYAVRTTRIVCRPSCKSRVPSRENVEYFADVAAALANGYRPCKRCRPDLAAPYRPEREVVDKACDLLAKEFANPALLTELPAHVGVSKFHLGRLFKAVMGQTPKEYLLSIRLAKARELLAAGTLSVSQVCFETGFNSLSNFYALFRVATGLSPREYRGQAGVPADGQDGVR
ncbi:MAG: Ada metal-binding domain-containing protein [Negativicutes bacterium]|nr:Ada metal-binding domain-containing protein [Negativicutes bacterium]